MIENIDEVVVRLLVNVCMTTDKRHFETRQIYNNQQK
jgi:hypothetical protein